MVTSRPEPATSYAGSADSSQSRTSDGADPPGVEGDEDRAGGGHDVDDPLRR